MVVTSYQQTIRAYPNGGGSYIVSKDNLGVLPGLVAGAALLVDYVLTVAVSVSAGDRRRRRLGLPRRCPSGSLLCVVAIALLDAGATCAGSASPGRSSPRPLYVYLLASGGLLAYGLFRWATGTLPAYVRPRTGEPHWRPGQALGLLLDPARLLLRRPSP